MKKLLFALVLTFVAGNVLRFFLPWWSIVFAGALAGWFWPAPGRVFLGAFLGGLLLWGGYACYADIQNVGILSDRIGQLFKGLSSWQLIAVTGLLGGIPAGLGALCSAFARQLFRPAT
jgi:hypothetical protein